jgi:hypothetical protein
MAPATRRALADRAIWAAQRIDGWIRLLKAEAERQGVSFLDDDPSTPIVLRKHQVETLLMNMGEMAREIRRYQGRPSN